MRKVIVTGGAGFIGSHLAERLLADGNHVHVVDDFSTGHARNLEGVADPSRLTVHSIDVCEHTALARIFEGAQWVFHLAALADIVPSIEQPLDYSKTNVSGTFAALEAARRAGVTRFVYAASSSCYGIPVTYPTKESDPCAPEYPYALTKLMGEQAVLHWGRVYDLPVVSLRLFNVYGPRSRTGGTYGAMFGVFLAQKLAGKPMTIVGDGRQTRDFVYVTDVAEAFVKAASSTVAHEAFNVGTGRPVSVNLVASLLGGESTHIPRRPGEPDCTHADISKIRERLGWEPSVTIEEGVTRLLQAIELWRDAPVWTPESISQATQSWFSNLGRQDAR